MIPALKAEEGGLGPPRDSLRSLFRYRILCNPGIDSVDCATIKMVTNV